MISSGLLPFGIAVDLGTTKIAVARQGAEGKLEIRRERNAFLDLKKNVFARRMLGRLGIEFVEPNGRILVMGDAAFELANAFERETRRPFRQGVISASEPEAVPVLKALLERVVGPARPSGIPCVFTLPANPIDSDRDVLYQQGAMEGLLEALGYKPYAVGEGMAVVLSELEDEAFTGIGISCGGGMFNIAVAYKGVEALSFSITRGGDWIDQSVAHVLGMTAAEVCGVKEGGMDLRSPRDRVEEAIYIYTRALLRYALESIAKELASLDVLPSFNRPIVLACGGGAAMMAGFVEAFGEELSKVRFPLRIREVAISSEPIYAVARGSFRMLETLASESAPRRLSA
jgi:hypothetical protein